MDKKLFKTVNQFTGHYRFLDIIMIMISKKLRYLFAIILLIMWFRNNYHKRIVSLAGISAIITFFLTSVIKFFYFKPRPFLKKRVNLLPPVPSKKNSTFPSKHTTLAFATAISVLYYKKNIRQYSIHIGFLSRHITYLDGTALPIRYYRQRFDRKHSCCMCKLYFKLLGILNYPIYPSIQPYHFFKIVLGVITPFSCYLNERIRLSVDLKFLLLL